MAGLAQIAAYFRLAAIFMAGLVILRLKSGLIYIGLLFIFRPAAIA